MWHFPHSSVNIFKNFPLGTSLVVQQLRSHTSDAGGVALTPGQGTKVPRASCEVWPKINFPLEVWLERLASSRFFNLKNRQICWFWCRMNLKTHAEQCVVLTEHEKLNTRLYFHTQSVWLVVIRWWLIATISEDLGCGRVTFSTLNYWGVQQCPWPVVPIQYNDQTYLQTLSDVPWGPKPPGWQPLNNDSRVTECTTWFLGHWRHSSIF